MKKFLLFSLFSLFASTLAYAGCGSPPDPWGNASAYASWCSCMGGSYDYQTTACTGVSSGSSSSSSSSYSSEGSSGSWFCLAKSRKGACGYGFNYGTENAARQRALSECYKHSNSCYISYCNTRKPSGDPCKSSGASNSSNGRAQSKSTNSQYQHPSASFNNQSDDSQLAPSPFRPLTNSLLNKKKNQKQTKMMGWPTRDWTCTQCDAAIVNRISSRFGMVNNVFFYDWVYGNFGKFYECAGKTPQGKCPKGARVVQSIKEGCNKKSNTPDGYEACVKQIIDHS